MFIFIRVLYNFLLLILFAALLPFLPLVLLFSEKRRTNMLQRLGLIHLVSNKKEGVRRIWVHALSVGEAKSAVPLVRALKERYENQKVEIIVTVSTRTGFAVAKDCFLDPSAPYAHGMGYFPFDFFFSVQSICKRIDPDLVIIVESDLWPELLWYLHGKSVPIFLVNARLSLSSLKGYLRFRKIFTPLFSMFTLIMAQTQEDRKRFVRIGVPREKITVTGNIKFDQPVPEIDEKILHLFLQANQRDIDENGALYDRSHNRLHDRCCRFLLAGSTHPGEEEVIASVFRELRKQFSNIYLIVAPRDPGRALEVKKLFDPAHLADKEMISHSPLSVEYLTTLTAGMEKNKYSAKKTEDATEDTVGAHTCEQELPLGAQNIPLPLCGSVFPHDVVIVDKMGTLAALYGICDIAFVGGSLIPFGGHNPLEPALFSKPVLFGPHMTDFMEVADTLFSNGAAFQVADQHGLLTTLTRLLNDSSLAARTGDNGGRLFAAGKGAVDKIMSIIGDHV